MKLNFVIFGNTLDIANVSAANITARVTTSTLKCFYDIPVKNELMECRYAWQCHAMKKAKSIGKWRIATCTYKYKLWRSATHRMHVMTQSYSQNVRDDAVLLTECTWWCMLLTECTWWRRCSTCRWLCTEGHSWSLPGLQIQKATINVAYTNQTWKM